MNTGLIEEVTRKVSAGEIELVPLPETVAELMVLATSPRVDFYTLEALAARDPAMAAHVLRAASAPIFGAHRPGSLREAILRIGTRRLVQIALVYRLSALYEVPLFQARTRRVWAHARLSAVYAAGLARPAGADPERLFLCGLLHSAGEPALLRLLAAESERMSQPIEPALVGPLVQDWYPRIGALLVERYGLPRFLLPAVAHHRSPERCEDPTERRAARITGLARGLAELDTDDVAVIRGRLMSSPAVGSLDLEAEAVLAWLDLSKARARAKALGGPLED